MRDTAPPTSDAPDLHRSVVACLASILEVDATAVPLPAAGHPEPWTVWRNWLGQRGLGLVPVPNPGAFSWPGPWIAVLRSGDGDVGAVAFGSPPGLAWSPLGGPETFEDVVAGYLVAPADIALWRPAQEPASRQPSGVVDLIAIADAPGAPMRVVPDARAHAGRGLHGDRYHDGDGTFSNPNARGHDLTLIEAEVIDMLELPDGPLAPEAARRNVVTRGIDLNALVGTRFMIGEVECLGQRLCEPCAHLARLTQPAALRALVHRGGLRADVLSDGTIRVGDAVRVVEG